jgi:tRNA dimethylallyltransferase
VGAERDTGDLRDRRKARLPRYKLFFGVFFETPMCAEKQKIIIVGGPTASGKTSTGIRLAEEYRGEIVSADSVQVYRYLNIGSAKPTEEERSRARHHMLDIRDPHEEFTAGDYVREARACIRDITLRNKIPIIVGGTGLYIRALTGGLASAPPASRAVREKLKALEREHGAGTLHKMLASEDPASADRIPAQNLPQIIRALEVLQLTGETITKRQAEHAFGNRPYETLFVCVAPERPQLYERIDTRVDFMISSGLLKEVLDLLERGYTRELKPLQSLGYRHAVTILSGEEDRDEAIRSMKRDTRRYAKRQLTWFRSEPEALWFDPEDFDGIKNVVEDFLGA